MQVYFILVLSSGHTISSFEHMDAVYCVAPHPSSPEVVYTASEDGCVYIIDTRVARRQRESCGCGLAIGEELLGRRRWQRLSELWAWETIVQP